MVNDMLRLRSTHGKMVPEDGAPTMNPQQAKKLGRHLRRSREALGISARELARRADVDDSTIVRFEQGAFAEPSPDKLHRIARVLGLNLADLYVLADYPVPELPTLGPYLRAKYRDLPPEAAEQLDAYAQRLAKRHGVDLSGPAPGEDEVPDPRPNGVTRNKKGGAS
jgi:transcriptional regulator with XRE-family HTH domain